MEDTKIERIETAKGLATALMVLHHGAENNTGERMFVASFDTNTKEGLYQLERHECDAIDNGVSYVNTVLDIAAFSASVTELANEAGEFSRVPILTIETTEGKLVNLFSPAALRCFASRLRTHLADGALSKKHSLKLKLVQRQTDGARKMYWLERP